MAELNYAEKMNIGYENEYSTDAMTGGPDKRRQLYYQLIQSMKKAESVDIIVSFLMESGVKMLLQELENTLKRGAKIRILTGNYLGITQPSALYLIKRKLGDRVDLRFYCEKGRSFHPKSYIFHYADHSELYIGSSNISRSALTSGIEWNYRFSSKKDPENYAEFFYTFEDLFENHSIIIDDKELKRYSQNWHRPAVAKDLDKYDFEQDTEDTKIKTMYEPRGAQIEALCALEDTRAEGAKKALIQAATGIGKTYLAAFDSKPYEKVLFVAHREEILKQAADSFRNVRNSEDYGFFTGDEKCTDKSVIFASVATLGKSEYLNEKYFAPDYFNYVVIDEFHHAVNDQYRKIVEYFKPQFLLGLTATPERMDGKNIYEMGDKYNAEKVELGIRIELLCQISEENTARFYFTNYKQNKRAMWNAERRSEKLQIEKENKIVELDKIQKNLEKELSLYFSKSTMNEIYQKIDPHDVMKRLEYHLSFNDAQKGELFITLSESESDSDSDYRPEIYFSTAQLNTVAFSSFFSRALDRKNNLPIQTIFIDDPIGHFDDMNILGFADLMRSLIDNSNWQIVISTHDEKIFRILQRKLSGEYYSSCFLKLPSGKGIKWIE